MLRILIVYGTTDGQTRKIAVALADALRAAGATVDVEWADHAAASAAPEHYQAVIVAGSVHAGGYQKALVRWVARHAAALSAKPNVFVSVCLGVLEHKPATDAALKRIVDEFVARTGWAPASVKFVAGALKYRQYNLIKRWAMRRIVAKAGGDTDTSRDYEYTDWNDLRAFARTFALQSLASVRPR